LYAYSLLCIFAEFNDGRQGRTEDRRRGDRSREPSRERYYDPYDYNEYYRAAAYARGLYLLSLFVGDMYTVFFGGDFDASANNIRHRASYFWVYIWPYIHPLSVNTCFASHNTIVLTAGI